MFPFSKGNFIKSNAEIFCNNIITRNPIIADACFKSGYIDTWGIG